MNLTKYFSFFPFYNLPSTPLPPSPLNLSSFYVVKTVWDDTWNDYKNGRVCLSYYKSKDDVPIADPNEPPRLNEKIKYSGIGYIQYKKYVGQIGLIYLDDEYKGRTLGKQMLQKAVEDMESEEVWAVTGENHPFWSNVYDKIFTFRRPVHPSITGRGYYVKRKDLLEKINQ